MFGIQHYSDFVLAIIVFQLVPGPGILNILGATAQGGVRAGLGAVAGTLTGDLMYMVAAMLGLAAVLAAYPLAFAAMRWAGIAYLVWIGANMLLSREREAGAGRTGSTDPWGHVRRALAISLSNPKVILFFLAFFPIFMRPDSHAATLALMAVHVTLLSCAYQVVVVLAGNATAKRLARIPGVRKLAKRLAGLALVGFGVRLALDRR